MNFDIDLDFPDRKEALQLFTHIAASRQEDNKLVKHNSGVYMHNVPMDAKSGLCIYPYNSEEAKDYFKIDFLNIGIYEGVRTEAHLDALMKVKPIWELLCQDEITDLLYHVNGHGDILRQTKPKSVEQLAAVLAIIRPAKRYLVGKDWDTIMKEVWVKPDDDKYYFKKAHGIAYSVAIIVQLNLICEEMVTASLST